MTINDKLKFTVPVLIIILLILNYTNISDGYKFSSQIVKTDINDIAIMQELSDINEEYQLGTIEDNVKSFMIVVKSIFKNVEVSNLDSIEVRAGINKIGEFRNFIIEAQGDYLSQVYFLDRVNNKMRSFVMLNSIRANNNKIILNIRIYGKTNIKSRAK